MEAHAVCNQHWETEGEPQGWPGLHSEVLSPTGSLNLVVKSTCCSSRGIIKSRINCGGVQGLMCDSSIKEAEARVS